ncbi:hypothetical protein DL763_001304 [Monosporascus cannonballus]|nr:hypothetical protein DL763_001304 [Monosporascus cannonballus]
MDSEEDSRDATSWGPAEASDQSATFNFVTPLSTYLSVTTPSLPVLSPQSYPADWPDGLRNGHMGWPEKPNEALDPIKSPAVASPPAGTQTQSQDVCRLVAFAMQCDDRRELAPSPLATAPKATGDTGGRPQPLHPAAAPTKVKRESVSSGPVVAAEKRTVCDHCRRRRIRCDGQLPCQQCKNATLTCKRDHVPKKRGPKRGHGRVINELRAREQASKDSNSACDSDGEPEADAYAPALKSALSALPNSPHSSFLHWTASSPATSSRTVTEAGSPSTARAFGPNSRNYFHLIPQCVDLYYRHVYPIMPLLYMPALRATIKRHMEPTEKNLIYALCALTAFHMSGKSLSATVATVPPPAQSWEAVGRFFLEECRIVRRTYDFLEDMSLGAVVSSFWMSTSYFEISDDRKSWYYLRMAMNLALDMGLHDDASYSSFGPEDKLCRQRIFWILFVTERSFAILRNKPLTLRKTPSLPAKGHSYEAPEIHAGFVKLVRSYMPLDESFVNAWNDGSDPGVSATTYLHLQEILAQPLDFFRKPRRRHSVALAAISIQDDEAGETEPTAIQKADLLMTQQWLRLIVWQSSFRQGLLSTAASNESMTFSFPLSIARDTVRALQSLPSHAIEVHGMGIFEKIFEVGTWCVNVLGAYDYRPNSPSHPFGGVADGATGMDHIRGDLSLLTQGGRGGVHTDPLEFFVKMLSSSPNSRTMFAEKLLMFASEAPGSLRTALSPAPSTSTTSSTRTEGEQSGARVIQGDVSDDAAPDDDALTLKTELATEGSGPMEEVNYPSGWRRSDTTSTGSELDVMRRSTVPLISGFSDMTRNGEDYGFEIAPPTNFIGRGGPWSVPVGGAFFREMGMAPEEMTDDGLASVPRGQPGHFSNGMLGVW